VSKFRVSPVATAVPFDPDGTPFRSASTDVQTALIESKDQLVTTPDSVTTSLNGTTSLDVDSKTFQNVSGSATGHSLEFPDATTVPLGSEYQVFNNSSESIEIKDGASNTLFTLVSGDFVVAKLEMDGTAAGSWITIVTSASATGILSYVITSDTNFSTSSSTDALITGFTVTPTSGRYYAIYSSDLVITNNNRVAECVIFSGGTSVENTRRTVQGVGSNFESTQSTVGEITVNGSQAVDIRVNIDSGSININQRSLVLIRLGS